MARPRSVSDEDILDAARQVFIEHGFHVSTQTVADAVGLSAPALFKRFGSKENLFIQALAPTPPLWVVRCFEGPDDRSLAVQLHSLASDISAFFVEMAPRMSTLHNSGCFDKVFAAFDEPPPRFSFRALTTWFALARERGLIRDIEPAVCAELFISAVAYRRFASVLMGDKGPDFHKPDEEALQMAVDVLVRGLQPEEAP